MTVNWDILKDRYLQASLSVQMDSLSLNLVRLQTLAVSGAEEAVAHHLVRESQFFIEWFVSGINLEADILLATELLSLQRQLSQWKISWSELWSSESERQQISEIMQGWYERLQGRFNAIAS